MARSPDDESNRRRPDADGKIPAFSGAAKGLRGVKAPFGFRQHDDITDRTHANGAIRELGGGQLKFDKN